LKKGAALDPGTEARRRIPVKIARYAIKAMRVVINMIALT
jgi:hypothetical protein